jgi:hypothetical protein
MRCDWEVIRTDGFGHKECHHTATVLFTLGPLTWKRCPLHAAALRREYKSFPGLIEEPIA